MECCSLLICIVTAAFAIFAVVTLASAILTVVTASAAISAARIVPSKILAVVTASAAISAARIVPSKILLSLQHQLRYQRLESYRLNFAVVTASFTIATDPVLSIVTAPDNATALPPVLPTNICGCKITLEFNAVST
jgi:hypothetical protein